MDSFKKNKFYKLLPPQLKNQLVRTVLDKYYSLFEYFFNDPTTGIKADQVFVRKVLNALVLGVYQPN